MAEAFSIRTILHGFLHEFVESSGFKCVDTENLIRDIVSLLASYREEDVPLFPDVYVLSNPNDLRTLAPSVGSLKLGQLSPDEGTAGKILKTAAGLADGGWAIYVAKRDEHCFEYGVFRSQRHSFATSAEEVMRDLGESSPVVVLRNRGHLTVEICNTKAESSTVSLTSATPSSSTFAKDVDELVQAASLDVKPENVDQFSAYLSRVLTGLLQKCHGALIAVLDNPGDQNRTRMRDGVWLHPELDLPKCHAEAIAVGTAETLADLQAVESLFAGMINSDGVVVLGTNGTIRAFRVFLTPTATEKRKIEDKGGGRRRTFSLMKLRVQEGLLRAAFFRSQDGVTECQRRNDDK